MLQDRLLYNILFSCAGKHKKGYEPFVEEHTLSCILHGQINITVGTDVMEYKKGDIAFLSRNQLIKSVKLPDGEKPFMSINVLLTQKHLKEYSLSNIIKPAGNYVGKPNINLHSDTFLRGFFDSLSPYFGEPKQLTEQLAEIKTKEAISLLLRKPEIKNILFNFAEPFKIDLEAYMNRNFIHNISTEQFAKLTGRSLSTFKRDFKKLFSNTPEKWLLKKRLDLAHHLISNEGKSPTEIYFEVGFVNLSHFSDSFKKEFGVNASTIQRAD
jgi:AraC family transcriptional regulator, exoenzyme S synthesis regulatory protein ExsA